MLYPTTLVASVLTLVVCIVAAPHAQPLPVPETAEYAARGLIYAPQSLSKRKNNNNNKLVITTTEETQLTEIQQGSEIQLTEIVEKQLVVIDKTNEARDNVRKNHFKNVNSDKNLVLIVVVEIVDERDSSNKNTRYATHQVRTDNSNNEELIFAVISQAVQMTANSPTGTSTATLGQSTGSSSSAPSFGIYNATAAPTLSNSTQLLPAGAEAPFNNLQQFDDPAIIIEADQEAFVQFGQSS